MRTNLVYLAGPITGQSYEGATEWREHFKARIESKFGDKINCLSPMRGKHYLQSLQDISATGMEKYGILSGGPAVLTRDYSDTTSADILVVNLLGATKVSIGTMFEVAWAYSKHIPIVLVIEKGTENVHAHSMLLTMCGYQVDNVEDAITIVSAFFS
jgi:nucleoside 2-deoxyribosyltransferase